MRVSKTLHVSATIFVVWQRQSNALLKKGNPSGISCATKSKMWHFDHTNINRKMLDNRPRIWVWKICMNSFCDNPNCKTAKANESAVDQKHKRMRKQIRRFTL